MIKVLFDQRVIPNYRVGVFRKLAAKPDISLVVSYWSDSFLDRTPQVNGDLEFETVAFTPVRWQVRGKDYWFNLDLVKYLVKNKPDVVIGPVAMFGLHSIVSKMAEDLITLLIGTRFVYRVSFGRWPGQSEPVPRGLRKVWYRWLYRNVIVTGYTRRAAEVAKKQGCSPDRVLVDFNSMDSEELLSIRADLDRTVETWKDDFLRQYGVPGGGYVLFASRILPEKRLDVLIEAWKHVVRRRDDVQLVVVGSGPGKEQAVHQARDIADRVTFVEGIYDTEELAKFYHLASMVVFPGYATLSTHFAMCFGKPVVTSEYGNEAEYVCHNVNGLIYSYGDAKDLSAKVLTLLREETRREDCGEEAERIVRERINVAHMIDTWHLAIRLARG